jgi:hypothetical protein
MADATQTEINRTRQAFFPTIGASIFSGILLQVFKTTPMTAIRLLPGLIAAMTAYLALPLLSWVGFFPARFLVFVLIYTGVTLVLDIAMKRYRG